MNQCEYFRFDPDKTALENFFALIYRNNKVRLTGKDVDVGLPELLADDPDGDNTKILIKSKPDGPFEGEWEMYYGRANVAEHYPDFVLDVAKMDGVTDKASLLEYIDKHFEMVDGQFDLDLEDPMGSLLGYTSLEITSKDKSLVYYGKTTLTVIWSSALRRITDEGYLRMTDDGRYRVID